MTNRRIITPQRMHRSAAQGVIAALVVLHVVHSGCGEGADPHHETVNAAVQAYTVWDSAPSVNALTRRTQASAGGIRICLTGSGFTTTNRPEYEAAARTYVLAWVDAIRPVSTVPLVTASDITIDCASPHVTITWDASLPPRNAYAYLSSGYVFLFGQGATVLLHEIGHLFGLVDTYAAGVGACRPGQEQSVMCAATLLSTLQPDDVFGIQEAYCQTYPLQCRSRWETAATWCSGANQQLRVGDFNGDSRSDLVCHDPATGTQTFAWATTSGTFTGANSTSHAVGWCAGNTVLHVGDFNGDGRSDLLCNFPVTGDTSVALINAFGYLSTKTWSTMTYCAGTGRSFAGIGDFNGDRRSDVLCRWNDGTWVTYAASATGTFAGFSWAGTLGSLCSSTGRIVLGDFNKDARTDILCNEVNGDYRASYATASGGFVPPVQMGTLDAFCALPGMELRGGDVNADGRDDLLCRDFHSFEGATMDGNWTAFTYSDGMPKGSSQYWPRWCATPGSTVHVGDFDANGTADLLCNRQANGLAIHYSHPANVAVSVGSNFGCALKGNGFANCWGSNVQGEARPPLNARFSSLSLGAGYSAGIRTDGTLLGWGAALAPPSGTFSALAVGHFHACAIRTDGTAACWSTPTGNNFGQAPATRVSSWGMPYVAVSAGGAHTCALTNGVAECWGLNNHGQLLSPSGPFDRIAAGGAFNCARRANTSLACWGDNTHGQSTPPATTGFEEVVAGQNHACARRVDGTVICWGMNDLGQATAPMDTFSRISADTDTTCGVLTRDRSVRCWGSNSSGAATPPTF